jgi:hypothetical protein
MIGLAPLAVFSLTLLISFGSVSPAAGADPAPAEKTSDAEATFFELADKKARLVGEIADLKQKLAENKKKLPNVRSAEETLAGSKNELQKTVDEIEKLEKGPQDSNTPQQIQNLNAKKVRIGQEIRIAQNDLEGETSASLETAIRTGEETLAGKLSEQQNLERRILQMRTPAQEFKSQLSIIFAALIAFVIIGFFVIASIDDKVRAAIFSGQSGIQFLTLFSLVIAIILFGITGILEGKELAALLGGLSGYILGRSTTATAEAGGGGTPVAAAGPPLALQPPNNLKAEASAGRIKIKCDPVKGAKDYLWYIKIRGKDTDFRLAATTSGPQAEIKEGNVGDQVDIQVAVSGPGGTSAQSGSVAVTVA